MAKRTKRVAVVLCQGGCDQAARSCPQGCTGCTTCVEACRFGALALNENGVAVVDNSLCRGCGLCARKCPQGIIVMWDATLPITARCSNTDKGAVARKACTNSCIGCGMCERRCPAGAIKVVDNHAVIDQTLCIGCGMCAVSCPRGVIHDANGIFTVA